MQIHWHAYLNQTGYSISAQDYILAMKQVDPDINIKVHPQNRHHLGISPARRQIFKSLQNRADEDDQIHVYQTTPYRYRRHKGVKKCIGICLFETMNPPTRWIDEINTMDAIIVASTFNKGVFEASGVKRPIHIVPHCFDPKMFHRDVKPTGRYQLKTFFSIGTWKKRKNWEGLIKAFYDGFSIKDNVCLLIKTDKPRELESMVQRVKRTCEWRSKDTAPIYSEENLACPFEEIPRIMKKGDVYVCASRGEGYGLSGMHAMALGIPLVITRYSGVLEYARPGFCTYIQPSGYKTEATMDGIPQFNNCIWPHIKIGEIRDRMKQSLNAPLSQVDAAYDFVHKNFNYDVIGKKMIEVIRA